MLLISRIAFAGSLSIVGLIAIALFFFAVPVWDDLIRATRPLELGWWGYVIDFVYKHWQGRWASCGLESFILPHVDLTRHYGLLIGGIALVDALGVYVVCRWFTPQLTRKSTLFLALGLLALLWTVMPSVGETVYWFTGAVENALVYALAALLLIALLELPPPGRQPIWQRSLMVGGLSLAVICIVGFHELYGLMLCLALTLGAFAACLNPKADRPAWIVVATGAIAGLLIVALAPGNSARFITDGGPHARQFLYDLHVTLSQVKHFVPRWLLDPRMLAASVWVIASPSLRSRRDPSGFPWRFAIPLAWLIMLAAGFFAPSWAFGKWMPPRTISGVYIIFTIGWLVTLNLWSTQLPPWLNRNRQTIRAIALLLFSISLFLPGSAYAAAHDLYHRIPAWHTAMEHRYALLRNAEGTDALVPLLPSRPWVLLDGEIDNDPVNYRNWGTVSFFHLRSIRLMPLHGPPPPPPEKPTRPPSKGT